MEILTWIFGIAFVFVWICWFVLKLVGNKNSDIPSGRYPHHKDKKRKRKI